MQIDLRTVNIKPKRNAFDHLVERFGDKHPSRYQEATYDIQATDNLQYRPTWDPQREIYDVRRTKIVMADWYAFKYPRQFYYSAYTMARAKMQETAESNFGFVESRALINTLPSDIHECAQELLVPLRHAAWGANMLNSGMCADGYGTAITQGCIYQAMDDLGIAQYLTRVGLALGDADSLDTAKTAWLEDDRWQPLRRYVEELLIVDDWFEIFVAQNVVLDGLLYPLVYHRIVDSKFTAEGGPAISMLTTFMTDWFKDSSRWTSSVMKIAAAESDVNKAQLVEWINSYLEKATVALQPLAEMALPTEADAVLAEVVTEFRARIAKQKIEL